jgi:hypothetical protein
MKKSSASSLRTRMACISIILLVVVGLKKQWNTLEKYINNVEVANEVQRKVLTAAGSIPIENTRGTATESSASVPAAATAPSANYGTPNNKKIQSMAFNGTETVPSSSIMSHTKRPAKKLKNDCIMPEISIPQRYELPNTTFLSLHPGKGGGGTVHFRMRSLWGLHYSFCHWGPCPVKKEKAKFIEINIRDPVDRFVSSFYWRMQHYSKLIKRQLQEGLPVEEWNNETKILYLNYKGNVNLLAEALCGGNETLRDQAIHDIKYKSPINHGRLSLTDWVPRRVLSRTDSLIPIVLEKGADIEAQIDDTVRYVYNNGGFEGDPESFAHREEWVHWHNCKMTKPSKDDVHSTGRHVGLSKLGEKCVARYFAKDYKLLKEMLEKKVCKTLDCEIGLKNILRRRQPLLVEEEQNSLLQ